MVPDLPFKLLKKKGAKEPGGVWGLLLRMGRAMGCAQRTEKEKREKKEKEEREKKVRERKDKDEREAKEKNIVGDEVGEVIKVGSGVEPMIRGSGGKEKNVEERDMEEFGSERRDNEATDRAVTHSIEGAGRVRRMELRRRARRVAAELIPP